MTETQRLVADYVNHDSETAFRELTTRYLDLVYSTALRLVDGNTQLAEDLTQMVFVDLARLAKNLSREVRLGGWLHRHTCFVAAKTLRSERRREAREREAAGVNTPPDHRETEMAQVASLLDEAINALGSADRAAVLLRFYERQDFKSVGEAMGTSEAAAQKRVTRALEKLHLLLKHRGVTLSIAALATALTGEAVKAAPAGLAASVPAAALVLAAGDSGSTSLLSKIMAATKLKSGIAAVIVVASVMMPLLVQQGAQAKLREQADVQEKQAWQLARLEQDNEDLNRSLASAKNTPQPASNQLTELLRLRNEVGRLKQDVQQISSQQPATPPTREDQLASMKQMYAARVDRLKQWLDANPSEKIPEFRNLRDDTWLTAVAGVTSDDDLARAASNLRANAEMDVMGSLSSALRKFGKNNGGQFPTDLSQLTPYFKTPIDDDILQRYEIVPANSLVAGLQPGGDLVITEKAPVNADLDLRMACSLTGMCNANQQNTNRWTMAR